MYQIIFWNVSSQVLYEREILDSLGSKRVYDLNQFLCDSYFNVSMYEKELIKGGVMERLVETVMVLDRVIISLREIILSRMMKISFQELNYI